MKTKRPPVVWTTQIVLAISAAAFGTAMIGVFFIYGGASLFHVQSTLLLVLMPIAAFVGLARRTLWGREVALLSLACLWAYILHGYLSTFGDKSFARILQMPHLGQSTFIFLIVLLVLIPCLFGKLRWGSKECEFFES